RRHTRSKRDWSSDVCSSDLIEALFIGPARFLGSKRGGKTERVAFDIREALEMNNTDFRVVEGSAETKDDRIREEARKVGSDFASRQAPLVDSTLRTWTNNGRTGDAGVGENGGILAPHHKIEIVFGVGICLGANDAIA